MPLLYLPFFALLNNRIAFPGWLSFFRVICEGSARSFALHLGSQPSDYRAYKGFTDIIVPLKSFHRVAATVDITDVNRLSLKSRLGCLWEGNCGGVMSLHAPLDMVKCMWLCGIDLGQMKYHFARLCASFLKHVFLGGNTVWLFQMLWGGNYGSWCSHFKVVRWCFKSSSEKRDLHLQEQVLPLLISFNSVSCVRMIFLGLRCEK